MSATIDSCCYYCCPYSEGCSVPNSGAAPPTQGEGVDSGNGGCSHAMNPPEIPPRVGVVVNHYPPKVTAAKPSLVATPKGMTSCQNDFQEKRNFRVIVIGAGLAGLSAANYLVTQGGVAKDEVVVLEARDRVGGRIFSSGCHTSGPSGNDSGRPLELGAQWIHGGCPANSVFNLANKYGLFGGEEVHRLYEEADESGDSGDNLLRRWPTTKGYFYKSDGVPLSNSASRHAYHIFNRILDEADAYNRNTKAAATSSHRTQNNTLGRYNNYHSTRLSTFYNGRKRKALESLRKTPEASSDPALLTEVELALAGLARVFSVEAGDDLSKVRLQMIGARQTLPGGHVPVTDSSGLGRITDRLASDLGEGSLRLGHTVKHIDWSLLGGRGGVSGSATDHSAAAGKIAVECHRGQSESAVLYMADYVIVTLPIGVLKDCHQHLFFPKLPISKAQSIENIGCGKYSKIFLEWHEPWWAPGEGGIQLAWPGQSSKSKNAETIDLDDGSSEGSSSGGSSSEYENGDSSTMRRGRRKGGGRYDNDQLRHWYRGISNFSEVDGHRNLLMCWVAGDSARIADRLDDEEIIVTVTDVLRRFLGDPGLSPPSRVHRHPWTSDPHALCTTSYPSLNTQDGDFDILASPLPCQADPRLLFAGEATHAMYWGQLLGARLSGLREGQRVVDRIASIQRIEEEMRKLTASLERSQLRRGLSTNSISTSHSGQQRTRNGGGRRGHSMDRKSTAQKNSINGLPSVRSQKAINGSLSAWDRL